MKRDWFEEIFDELRKKLSTASPEDIRRMLKNANYEHYTGVNPDSLEISSSGKSSEQREERLCDRLKTHSWKLAYEARACPGDEILFSKRKDNLLKQHVSRCRLCQVRLENQEDLSAWKIIADTIKSDIKGPVSKIKRTAAQGQIWSISRELNGWGDGDRYYNAPMVLLLEPVHEDGQKKFKVAQVYSDRAMMAPGDIWLGDEYGFAESWNIYSVPVGHLESCWGKVEQKLVQAVQEAGAPQLAPAIVWHDRYTLFRNLETDVGSFFIERIYQIDSKANVAKEKIAALVSEFQRRIQEVSEGLKDGIDWLSGVGGLGEGELIYVRAAASDVPPQSKAFPLGPGMVTISIHWVPAYRKAPALFTIHWERDFVSAAELWLRFVDPQKDAVRKDINLGASSEGERSFDSGELGFDPSTEEWTIHVALVPPAEITEGVITAALKAQTPLLILTDPGLRKLSEYFAPELTSELGRSTNTAVEWPRQEAERLEKLRQDFAILPVKLESIADNRSTRIAFKSLGAMQKQKPKVHVTFKGKSILKKNVRWETWPSDAPVLTIQDCEIPKKDWEGERLLTIGFDSELNLLMLNLL